MARILVVEDEFLVAATLCETLQERGHEVLHAANGGAALAALEVQQPDLVVTDYRMPRLDGAELVDAIRRDPRWAALPVLMVSAYPAPTAAAMPQPAPAFSHKQAFIQKPFTPEALGRAVDALLGRTALPA